MLNLNYSYNPKIEKAYIITIKNNLLSERYSLVAQDSCKDVQMPYIVWDAYDGTGSEIIEPEHSKDSEFMQMLKVTNHFLTRAEVACVLSHVSLWVRCVVIDQPIVILEHDAVMIKKIEELGSINAVVYLGGHEWVSGWPVYSIPPFGSEGPNFRFICRAHAYAIDPQVAKNMLSHVLKMGIHASVDCMLRADIFNITHQGFYAFDKHRGGENDTTIVGRQQPTRPRIDKY